MKYVIIIPDGCADEPQDSLAGKTPVEAARLTSMDQVAHTGMVGRSSNVPDHLPAGSEVANMSLLGYDPNVFFTGRAPIEAAAQDIELGELDWAMRCNLVTITDQTMKSFTAGHISTDEADQLLKSLSEAVTDNRLEFVTGVSYRNLVLLRGDSQADANAFSSSTVCRAPHDLTDQTVIDDFPRGCGSDLLNEIMRISVEVFKDHPVNKARIEAGKLPATNVWLWGIGKAPQLVSFHDRYQLSGTMITAVDLLRGLAKLIGWSCTNVEGATGYLDTDYQAKGKAAVQAIREHDVVCVHIEAPDEASHEGRIDAKIEALESIDELIVKPILNELKNHEEWRLLITPDHATPVRTKTHCHGFVPFAIAGTGIKADEFDGYGESNAEKSKVAFPNGWELMDAFIGKTSLP